MRANEATSQTKHQEKRHRKPWLLHDRDLDLNTLKMRLSSQSFRVFSHYSTKEGVVYRLECSKEKTCPIKIRIRAGAYSDYYIAEIVEGSKHVHQEPSIEKEKLEVILKQDWIYNLMIWMRNHRGFLLVFW